MLLAVAVGRDRPSRRNLAGRWPVPLPCSCPCQRQLARRAAVPSCLPKAPDAASSCCYLRARVSTTARGTGGPQRTGVYVQFKIQALPHYPLPPEKPSTASEEEVLCSASWLLLSWLLLSLVTLSQCWRRGDVVSLQSDPPRSRTLRVVPSPATPSASAPQPSRRKSRRLSCPD